MAEKMNRILGSRLLASLSNSYVTIIRELAKGSMACLARRCLISALSLMPLACVCYAQDVVAIVYENGSVEELSKPQPPTLVRMEKGDTKVRTETLMRIATRDTIDITNIYDKSQYGPRKFVNALFITGGIIAVTGIAATYLLPPTIENDYSHSTNGTYTEIKKRNSAFMIAGGIAGSVCIGAGFYFLAKTPKRMNSATSEQSSSRNTYMCLNIIATGNGAGLRLTF